MTVTGNPTRSTVKIDLWGIQMGRGWAEVRESGFSALVLQNNLPLRNMCIITLNKYLNLFKIGIFQNEGFTDSGSCDWVGGHLEETIASGRKKARAHRMLEHNVELYEQRHKDPKVNDTPWECQVPHCGKHEAYRWGRPEGKNDKRSWDYWVFQVMQWGVEGELLKDKDYVICIPLHPVWSLAHSSCPPHLIFKWMKNILRQGVTINICKQTSSIPDFWKTIFN